MRTRHTAIALGLLATTALSQALIVATALAATVNDYYGKWSRSDCAEEWVQFTATKVTQYSDRFQPVETAQNPSAAAARRPAPAPAAAPKPAEPAPTTTTQATAAPTTARTAAKTTEDTPRNPATARRLVNNPNEEPRNPATARKIVPDPKPAAKPAEPAKPATAAAPAAPASPAKPGAKGKAMDTPGTVKLEGETLVVETQETGRKPRREVYRIVDKDTIVLDSTFVDGRRIPPITRDAVTYKRCK